MSSINSLDQILDVIDRELIGLLSQLIQIPSWVPDDEEGKRNQNEVQLIEFIEEWLKSKTDLEVRKQPLDYGRFNLIASKGRPDVVFLAHVDTVGLPANSIYPPLSGEIYDGKVWGRGSSDMKCGIASLMQAFELSPNADNYWVFFYADEEYDFLGMKALVQEFAGLLPKYIISADGTDLRVGYGCRGLIEIRAQVEGLSAHATSLRGRNAIQGVFSCVKDLDEFFENNTHSTMGRSSLNLAYVLGGKNFGTDSFSSLGRLQLVGQEGNVVPDIAEFVIDVRPSSPDISVEKILHVMSESLEKSDMKFVNAVVRHNLGAWFTELSEIDVFTEIAREVTKSQKVKLSDPKRGGYLDIQMLWNALGKPASLVFGGGTGSLEHTDNENVEIDNVVLSRDFFVKVLNKFC